MNTYHLTCDYLEGCHENILKVLNDSNLSSYPGYGLDYYCDSAKEKIRKAIGINDFNPDIYFIVGGTQTNLIAVSSILRPYEGAICCTEGHINTHETGAVEATGHKVLTLPTHDGKLCAKEIDEYCADHFNSPIKTHLVKPGMIYISQPTELGTLYSKEELKSIYEVAKKYDLQVFCDGARLGYALGSSRNDVTLADLATYTDLFYIGGTKCGAMMGEALVICNDELKKDFAYNIKTRGALLAKGRFLGMQFDPLFTDNLYFDICKNAVDLAERFKAALKNNGIELYNDSPTNQIFFYLTDSQLEYLSKYFEFQQFGVENGRAIYRACMSWATKDSLIDDFNDYMSKFQK